MGQAGFVRQESILFSASLNPVTEVLQRRRDERNGKLRRLDESPQHGLQNATIAVIVDFNRAVQPQDGLEI
jgi:hypothetical protein